MIVSVVIDPTLYDLTLNTERVSIESCIDEVVKLVARPEFAETPESKQKLADMALRSRWAGWVRRRRSPASSYS